MPSRPAMCQLQGGKKDGHIFRQARPLKKYLYFSPEVGEDNPDILSDESVLPHLIYAYAGRKKSKVDGKAYEFYRYFSRMH